MKPEELRIGNYATKNKTGEQYALSANDIANFTCSALMQPMFSPIELSGWWLERLGFTYKPGGGPSGQDMWAGMGFIYKNNELIFRGSPTHLHLIGYFNAQARYVHQLQNLWYALTGEELTFNT